MGFTFCVYGVVKGVIIITAQGNKARLILTQTFYAETKSRDIF